MFEPNTYYLLAYVFFTGVFYRCRIPHLRWELSQIPDCWASQQCTCQWFVLSHWCSPSGPQHLHVVAGNTRSYHPSMMGVSSSPTMAEPESCSSTVYNARAASTGAASPRAISTGLDGCLDARSVSRLLSVGDNAALDQLLDKFYSGRNFTMLEILKTWWR